MLADTQRHLKHGTCPRVLTIWLRGAELYTVQCSAYVPTNGLRATSEASLQEEEKASPRLSNNLQGGLPAPWGLDRDQVSMWGPRGGKALFLEGRVI